MILNNADDIRIGTEEVAEVRLGNELIWSRNQFWTFATPAAGTELSVLANWDSDPLMVINWGDDTSSTLSKETSTIHTY